MPEFNLPSMAVIGTGIVAGIRQAMPNRTTPKRKPVTAAATVADDLDYLPMNSRPKRDKAPVAPISDRPTAPADSPPREVVSDYVAPKTAKEYAQDIMRDLPKGVVVQIKTGNPVTTELATRDFDQYNIKSSKTKQKIMDELARLGVVQKRPNRAALVVDKYQYQDIRKSVIDALSNKRTGFTKAEAAALADSSSGSTEKEWITAALKSALPKSA